MDSMPETLVCPGDVILVHVDEKPAFFGRVEEIRPDVKPGWRHLRFTVLTVPLQEVTWILEPSQIDGEPFTMGGTPMRIERLPESKPEVEDGSSAPEPSSETPGGRVISFPGSKQED